MVRLEFTIPGEPKGKGRPRFGRSGHAYTPHDTAAYENLVKLAFREAYPDMQPIAADVPIECFILAFYGIPKSASKKKHKAMYDGDLRPLKKPDSDNIIKIVCDALNNIAYDDDCQIVKVCLAKWYDTTPRVVVRLEYDDGKQD